MAFIEKLHTLQEFLQKLTWGKIAQLVILFFVISSAWIIYESRNDITTFIQNKTHPDRYTPLTKRLSKATTNDLDNIVTKISIISAIDISFMDFKTNTRYVVYLATDNKSLKDIYNKYDLTNLAQPLFTNNDEYNRRIINLINGEFICSVYSAKVGDVDMPESSQYISTVCSNGIPPYYGKIIGTISILLKREPTMEEIDELRVLIKNLSIMIYNRDLK